MLIGETEIEKTACLAPMAGVADRAFRELCRSYGAAMVTGEMASAKGMVYGSKKTGELLEVSDKERPMGVQLFGSEPEAMSRAARMAMGNKPDFIDINMGCPAPKITGGGGGSRLMLNPRLAGEITRAVVKAVGLPIMVKIRKGYDAEHINAVELAKYLEDNGAAAITVHGRTREQMYAPPADWEIITRVKEAVRIPVIGNGDVTSAEACARMYRETGCDLVMIGRGALGQPWIFSQIKALMSGGTPVPEPTVEERMQALLRQAALAVRYKGEDVAMREVRKHAAWYCKGMHGAAALRRQAGTLLSCADLERLAEQAVSDGRREEERGA